MKKRLLVTSAAVAALGMATMTPAVAGGGSSPPWGETSPSARWRALEPGAEPEVNPLKGFAPFAGEYDTFPHSLEWSYFPLDAVMTGPDTFDWTVLETSLDEIAARGHQTAMRFYLDYPQRDPGIPQYLLDGGLETRTYDDYGNAGLSLSPDYDDPALREALAQFIEELGARYDGDPRIAYLQAGLVGFWGEWHTYPYNGDGTPDWMPSAETQREIMVAFDDAFDATELEVRYPTPLNVDLDLGYHDDSFAFSTKRSSFGWYFMDLMDANGTADRWRTSSIGGELRPELQRCIFTPAGCPDTGNGADNDFAGSVEQTHATWLINHAAFADGGLPEPDRSTAIDAARSLGYSFRVTEALVPRATAAGDASVGITVTNDGVAPFYAQWPTDVALVDEAGAEAYRVTTDWRLADVPVGEERTFTATLDLAGVAPGRYSVVVAPVNPLAGGVPLRFANAAQDSVRDGWLTLGSTRVHPGRHHHG